jgi:hypothetical protein
MKKMKFIAYDKEGNEVVVNKPTTIFEIDPELYLSNTKKYNQYDGKPIYKFDHDMFATYVLDKSVYSSGMVTVDCYFSICFDEYFNDLPNINAKRVFLYGVFDIIVNMLNDYKMGKNRFEAK